VLKIVPEKIVSWTTESSADVTDMRAVTFSRLGGPEVLEVSELPEPTPGGGEVRIRVAAATVNPTDISFRSGRQFTVDQLAEMGVRPPFIPAWSWPAWSTPSVRARRSAKASA